MLAPAITARAHRLADLHRGEADAAGRAEHQQRLAGLEPSLPADRHVARDVGDGKCAGLVEVHASGNRERLDLVGQRLLGQAAVGEDGHHAIARREARHAVATGGDDAGGLQTRAERQRRLGLVAPGHHDRVGVVHRRRLDVDQHLTRAHLGRRDVLERQRLDLAPGAAEQRAHQPARSSTASRSSSSRRRGFWTLPVAVRGNSSAGAEDDPQPAPCNWPGVRGRTP